MVSLSAAMTAVGGTIFIVSHWIPRLMELTDDQRKTLQEKVRSRCG